MASKEEIEAAGNDQYKENHLAKMLREGFSFSGFERDGCYLNLGNKKYRDISGVSGIDSETDGRASVFADFDNDGDLDVFVTVIQGQSHLLFRNNVGSTQGSVRLALEGKESGRDAAGAVVRVQTTAGMLTKVKAVGNGYLSQHDPRLLFGLGTDAASGSIEITWPSGRVQSYSGVPAGTSWIAREGEPALIPVRERRSALPDPLREEDRMTARLRPRVGERLPDFDVRSLDGEQSQSIHQRLGGGKRHLINLWATWCVPCKKEIPELEKRRVALSNAGVEIVGVSLDTHPARDVASGFETLGGRYPCVIAAPDAPGKIYATGEIFVPVSILVDEEGVVRAVFEGWTESMRTALDALVDR